MQMVEMNLDEFTHFKTRSINNLAVQQAEDFGYSTDIALEKSLEKFHQYLPNGLKTAGHYFYHIKNDQNEACGYLWFGEREENNNKKIFIYDILVEEEYRGQGFGKWMLTWLEHETKKLNLSEISLHVLGSNYIARELYESMDFEITNIYMSKKIK